MKTTIHDTLPNPCEMRAHTKRDELWLTVIAPRMPEVILGKDVAFMRLNKRNARKLRTLLNNWLTEKPPQRAGRRKTKP